MWRLLGRGGGKEARRAAGRLEAAAMVQVREHGGWNQDVGGEMERRDELGIQVWGYC